MRRGTKIPGLPRDTNNSLRAADLAGCVESSGLALMGKSRELLLEDLPNRAKDVSTIYRVIADYQKNWRSRRYSKKIQDILIKH
jgi:hypothetical protein